MLWAWISTFGFSLLISLLHVGSNCVAFFAVHKPLFARTHSPINSEYALTNVAGKAAGSRFHASRYTRLASTTSGDLSGVDATMKNSNNTNETNSVTGTGFQWPPRVPERLVPLVPLLKEDAVGDILQTYRTDGAVWPASSFMRVRGVNVHYKDSDPSGRSTRGKPVYMLLHGFAGSTASWDEVIEELAPHGRVIAFDRPGFGLTERVMPVDGLPWSVCPRTLGENPYTARFCAQLMYGILDRLGLDDIIVVSHSLGAQVALRAVLLRPRSVRALILTAPAILNPLDSGFSFGKDDNGASLLSPVFNLKTRLEVGARISAMMVTLMAAPTDQAVGFVRNTTLNEDLEARVRRNFHDPTIIEQNPALVYKYISPLREPDWDKGLVQFYRAQAPEAMRGELLIEQVRRVWKGPVLVMAGDTDPTVPLSACTSVAELFSARLLVVEQCAHIPMDEKPDVWLKAVLSFSRSREVASSLVRRLKPWRRRAHPPVVSPFISGPSPLQPPEALG